MALENSFKSKNVLITGAGRGLGKALVKRLHSYGANVYALSRTKSNLDNLIKENPGVQSVCADLMDWSSTRNSLEKLPIMHYVINNAGYLSVDMPMSAKPEDFDKMFEINVKSVLNVCQVMGRKMVDAGVKGSIVNVSSVLGGKPGPYAAIYGSSKAALEMLSKCLALELAPKSIRVNIFQPGSIDTDMIKEMKEGVGKIYGSQQIFDNVSKARTPTGQPMMPIEECVTSCLFLLSDLNSQIVGSTLTLDGGFLCT